MAEFPAMLRYLWIEHGDTGATVLLLLAVAVSAIRALRKGGKSDGNR